MSTPSHARKERGRRGPPDAYARSALTQLEIVVTVHDPTHEPLQSLIQQWSSRSISTNEIARELRGLHDAFANAYYREKVRNAIEWATMSSQEAQEYGGEQQVHEFMLSELTVAARVAGQLQGKE